MPNDSRLEEVPLDKIPNAPDALYVWAERILPNPLAEVEANRYGDEQQGILERVLGEGFAE